MPCSTTTRSAPASSPSVADPEDYATFQARGRMCGWCSEPVRLIGTSKTLDAETGEIVESFSTDRVSAGGNCSNPAAPDERHVARRAQRSTRATLGSSSVLVYSAGRGCRARSPVARWSSPR